METAATASATVLSARQREAALRTFSRPSRGATVVLCGLIAPVAWSASGTELSLARLTRGIPLIFEFVVNLWPPDNAYWLQMLDPISVTLQMALLGTLVSVVLAFPFGLLAARNTMPSDIGYQTARMILNVIPAIPSLVWAIILVAALGFGPFAGVLALGIGGVGTLGKLYAEAIEAINSRPVEAIRATGSAGLAIFTVAVLPQAMPLMISYTLLDFEANIPSATILGIAGAGGVGFEVQAAFSQFLFHRVLTILIEIVVTVTVFDRLSAFIRASLI
jgi:phosphonate transport system permease protein